MRGLIPCPALILKHLTCFILRADGLRKPPLEPVWDYFGDACGTLGTCETLGTSDNSGLIFQRSFDDVWTVHRCELSSM